MVATIVPKKTKTFTIPFPVETSVRKDLTSLFNSFILFCIVCIRSAHRRSWAESRIPVAWSTSCLGDTDFFLAIRN